MKNTIDLTVNITASRNPVTVNVPALSTSELTCHVDGILDYPELTYLWNTGETTKQITVQPTEPTTYTCTVTQGSRTANTSILIDTILRINELPVAIINTDNVITIPKGPVAIIKANGGIYG